MTNVSPGGAVSGSTSLVTTVVGGSGVRSKSRLRRYSESVTGDPEDESSHHHPMPTRTGVPEKGEGRTDGFDRPCGLTRVGRLRTPDREGRTAARRSRAAT